MYIISPHIDDAIFSIGGFIIKACQIQSQIDIKYIFSISDWINSNAITDVDYPRDREAVTRLRKDEEYQIKQTLSYECDFLDFLDQPLLLEELDIQELSSQVEVKLMELLSRQTPSLFPLGKRHVHHEIIGNIGLSLLEKKYPIIFYEDLPYFARNEYNYEAYFSQLSKKGFSPWIIQIDMNRKLALMQLYKSQLCKEWLKDIVNYSYDLQSNKYFERLWIHDSVDISTLKVFS